MNDKKSVSVSINANVSVDVISVAADLLNTYLHSRQQCVCDAAWTGEHCAHIKFGKVRELGPCTLFRRRHGGGNSGRLF